MAKCNGLCLDSGAVGVPGYGIAYAHPDCPEHGEPHDFDPVDVHCSGAARCRCGAYEDEHAVVEQRAQVAQDRLPLTRGSWDTDESGRTLSGHSVCGTCDGGGCRDCIG